MADKVLMKGNEAIAEAAILAGCRHYFGYPITPQNLSRLDRRSCQENGGKDQEEKTPVHMPSLAAQAAAW